MTLFDLLAEGVRDYKLPALSITSGSSDVDSGHAATGWLSTIGPFPAQTFSAALDALVVREKGRMVKGEANPAFILSQPWRIDRMDRALSFDATREPPQIDVKLLAFPGLPDFYRVVDGSHRSFAARRNCRKSIRVLLHQQCLCDPTMFRLENNALVRKDTGDPLRIEHDPDIIRIWQCLGVETQSQAERDSFITIPIAGLAKKSI